METPCILSPPIVTLIVQPALIDGSPTLITYRYSVAPHDHKNHSVSYHCSSSDSLSKGLIDVSSSLNFNHWSLVIHKHKNHPVIHPLLIVTLIVKQPSFDESSSFVHKKTRNTLKRKIHWREEKKKKKEEKKTSHKKLTVQKTSEKKIQS